MLSTHDQDRHAQITIGSERCRLLDQGAEIEQRFRSPTDERGLHGGPQCRPRAGSAPVVDESGCCTSVVAVNHALRRYTGNIGDLRKRRRASIAHDPEEMKGGRLVEREAGDAAGPCQCHVQGKATPIGVTDQMNLSLALVDEVDGPRRFVRQREGMRAGPGTRSLAAVVLGSQ